MLHILTKFDSIARPIVLKLPGLIPVFFYSYGRKLFLNQLFKSTPKKKIEIPIVFQREFWGIKFQSNIFNAAGIFKEIYGYELCYRQGAAAFLVGTITPRARVGNTKKGIKHPFIPLHNSHSAINWMGLPNVGIDEALSRISKIEKKKGCPIGVSISSQPDDPESQAIKELIEVFKLIEQSQIDFIELNESCPNVAHAHSNEQIGNLDKGLVDRLELISKSFLTQRKRLLPVVVKFSNDTAIEQVDELVELLINLKFDGINFGNTSTKYSEIQNQLNESDIRNFQNFTQTFGGGVSGSILRGKSLLLCNVAAEKSKQIEKKTEFIVIRTGGIENENDIFESNSKGIHLNQWFTGYFEAFSEYGHYCYSSVLILKNKNK